MINLPTPSRSRKLPPPKIATPEFQFQQMDRISISIEQTGKSIDQHIQTGLDEEYHGTRVVRITETNVWATTIVAGSANEAEQKAERTTRGWEEESSTLVFKAEPNTNVARAEDEGDEG
jgi:hypothetical protein